MDNLSINCIAGNNEGGASTVIVEEIIGINSNELHQTAINCAQRRFDRPDPLASTHAILHYRQDE
jgi:hypothetical protein